MCFDHYAALQKWYVITFLKSSLAPGVKPSIFSAGKNITRRLPRYFPTGVAYAQTGCMLKNVSVDTGDVAYCTNRIERSRALVLVIPPRANRKSPEHPDYRRYKGPNA